MVGFVPICTGVGEFWYVGLAGGLRIIFTKLLYGFRGRNVDMGGLITEIYKDIFIIWHVLIKTARNKIYIHIHIQVVLGGMFQTSRECSLSLSTPI